MKKNILLQITAVLFLLLVVQSVFAHGMSEAEKQTILQGGNLQYLKIGATHMLTGYDHLLFVFGIVFFLTTFIDVVKYITAFTIGHSITLITATLMGVTVNYFLIDAVIAFSIIYKGFDNLGGFKLLFGRQPNTKIAVLIFGLFHGFGLATKLQDFSLPEENLMSNMLAFNVGVEIGQGIALLFILTLLGFWRRHNSYFTFANASNTLLMSGGLVLLGFQLTGYFTAI